MCITRLHQHLVGSWQTLTITFLVPINGKNVTHNPPKIHGHPMLGSVTHSILTIGILESISKLKSKYSWYYWIYDAPTSIGSGCSFTKFPPVTFKVSKFPHKTQDISDKDWTIAIFWKTHHLEDLRYQPCIIGCIKLQVAKPNDGKLEPSHASWRYYGWISYGSH